MRMKCTHSWGWLSKRISWLGKNQMSVVRINECLYYIQEALSGLQDGYVLPGPGLNFKNCCFTYWGRRHIAVTVSTHRLCVICGHFCSNVAVSRLYHLSEFTLTSWAPALTGPHFSVYECKGNVGVFPRDKENWPYHSDVKLLHCVNQVRPRCCKCWVYLIILRNYGGRIMNSLIVHVRLLSVENEALLKLKKF